MLDGVWGNGFATVLPMGEYKNELPQDFPTRKEVEENGNEQFGEGNYVIESSF